MSNVTSRIPIAFTLLLTVGISLSRSEEPSNSLGDYALNYHLMHPGDQSWPQDPRLAFTGDPNAGYQLDGTYHLHYIFKTSWKGQLSFAYAHVTSPDMLHWTWQPTKLTAFVYRPRHVQRHGVSDQGWNAGDDLSRASLGAELDRGGERPAALRVGKALSRSNRSIGTEHPLRAKRYWDPDCFVIGDTYYSISGGEETPLFKSTDLETWTYVGPFMSHEPADVVAWRRRLLRQLLSPRRLGQVDAAVHQPQSRLSLLPWRLECRERAVRARETSPDELARPKACRRIAGSRPTSLYSTPISSRRRVCLPKTDDA